MSKSAVARYSAMRESVFGKLYSVVLCCAVWYSIVWYRIAFDVIEVNVLFCTIQFNSVQRRVA